MGLEEYMLLELQEKFNDVQEEFSKIKSMPIKDITIFDLEELRNAVAILKCNIEHRQNQLERKENT